MIKGLIGLIESKTAITDMIGTAPMRFYAKVIPQGQTLFPCLTFRTNNIIDTSDFSGPSTFDMAMVDIWSYGKNRDGVNGYAEALELQEVVRKELEGKSGTFNSIEIDDVFYMPSGMEDYLDELELYTKQLEIKVAYRRLVSV